VSESEAVERNRRVNEEALRRAAAVGASPARAAGLPGVAEAEQTVRDMHRRAIETAQRVEDATLSWASGNHSINPGGPRDIPFSGMLAGVAGAGGGAERTAVSSTVPRNFDHKLTSTPRGDEGQLSGVNAIVGFHENGGRK